MPENTMESTLEHSNETLRQLHARKSVRVYDPDRPVSRQAKKQLFEAAVTAPTAGCMTLYTILDITDQGVKDRLAILCDHQPFIASAPVVLVFLADWQRWYDSFCAAGDGAVRSPREGDLLLAVADAVIAAQNVVVAAESLGLGSCYIGDILENGEEVAQLLNIPRFAAPAAMLCIGYPAREQLLRNKPARFSPSSLVHENAYQLADTAALMAMHNERNPGDGFPGTVRNLCGRKWNSPFMTEMNRSASAWLKRWVDGNG
ncbi:MAG: nitroreductase family protein [Clostridia bacterium]|nr:nitroreductase family protein [Clostridia bacterium]